MTGAESRRPRGDDPDATRDEWLKRLDELVTQVKSWAERSGWRTRVIEKSMKDSVSFNRVLNEIAAYAA